MKNVAIYTDGACSGNPGPGGWGAILIYNGYEKEISGSEPNTTNNRMELMAAIRAIEALKEPCTIALYTDSAYLCHAFTERWLEKWVWNGWRTQNKKPVENKDLWERLLFSIRNHTVTWHKVKGHSDNAYNNRCDKLATSEVKKLKKQPNSYCKDLSIPAQQWILDVTAKTGKSPYRTAMDFLSSAWNKKQIVQLSTEIAEFIKAKDIPADHQKSAAEVVTMCYLHLLQNPPGGTQNASQGTMLLKKVQ